MNAYLSYNEGSRAPTAIELGCANPDEPCRLPNSMAGDPALKQVVTQTWETGVRAMLATGIHAKLALYRAENRDDILFVAAPAVPQSGFFRNFGRTRREGLEAAIMHRIGSVSVGANYTYLDATFQSSESVPGASNSSNSIATANPANRGVGGGTIQIRPGNRIPLIPQHLLKAYVDYQATPTLSFNVNVIAVGSSYARGNENNQQQSDGAFYLGSGKSSGYALVNLGAQYRVQPRLLLFAQINNLLDRQVLDGCPAQSDRGYRDRQFHRKTVRKSQTRSSTQRSTRRARRERAGSESVTALTTRNDRIAVTDAPPLPSAAPGEVRLTTGTRSLRRPKFAG